MFEDELTIVESKEDEIVLELDVPHHYTPYPFQSKAWDAKEQGYRNFVFVWHRRAGKDKTLFNMFISFIVDEWETPGLYFYCLPTATQGKKVIWNGIDNDGFKFIDHIPRELIENTTKQDMTIYLVNGSIIQIVGSDNYDRLVGSNPKGLCFSEYSVGSPLGWEFMRPVLKRNGGWALFPYTPRGKNHGYDLIEGAKKLNDYRIAQGKQPNWFIQIENVDTTTDHDGNKLLTDEDIEEERILGMEEDLIQQEYFCSFEAAVPGAVYGEQLRKARSDERIGRVPIDTGKRVYVFADIGRTDACAWWFGQFHMHEIRWINYYENRQKDPEHYTKYMHDWADENNVVIELVVLPHDAKHKTFIGGKKSAEDRIKAQGFKTKIAAGPTKVTRNEGMSLVRKFFPNFIFDEIRCKVGISALTSYHRKWDAEKKVFSNEPVHDWASNGSDAMRMFAVWYNEDRPQPTRPPARQRVAKSGFTGRPKKPTGSRITMNNRFGKR